MGTPSPPGYNPPMTQEDAALLAQFVKDHDKRFTAKAKTDEADEADAHVLLTRADDGTALPPITQITQYRADWIEGDDPGPTVRAAWDKWQPSGA